MQSFFVVLEKLIIWTMNHKAMLSSKEEREIVSVLKNRFDEYKSRHVGIIWSEVEERILKNKGKLWSLGEMERTGGEPDVIGYDEKTKEYVFCDCSEESPKGRRSWCYDLEALNSRKENKPKGSALGFVEEIGAELMNEEQYMSLQKMGIFDTKTSSWIMTPVEIRKMGGAIFADRRYDHVFVYHNGAESYYASRGLRVLLKV